MLAETRRREIAEALRSNGAVTVAELEARFGVSPMTARRDLDELERRGLVRRTHGGAVLPTTSAHEDSFARRMKVETEAKLRLAEEAVAMLSPRETVFLDSSTTSYFVAKLMIERGLAATVLTNSLPVMELIFSEGGPDVELIGIGGTLRRLTRSFVGPFAVRTVQGHFADRLFLSVKGLTETGMMTDADSLEAEVKRAMIPQAGESTLLVDHTKLLARGLSVVASVAGALGRGRPRGLDRRDRAAARRGRFRGRDRLTRPLLGACRPFLCVDVRVSRRPMGEREQWRRTLLAAMANYIDAGSIVAGAVSLPIWAAYFGFGDSFVSFLGAFSSNAIAAGLGALIGGRICDLLGRKKIYQWDLLLYAFGTLWIVFAFQEWMLLVGFFIVGLTVGADVPGVVDADHRDRAEGEARALRRPRAGALVRRGDRAAAARHRAARPRHARDADHLRPPARGRADHVGAAPGHDRVVAVGEGAEGASPPRSRAYKTLLSRRHAGALAFLIVMYGVWNLVAGTYGIFFPYILDAVGNTSDRANLALQAIWFVSTALAVAFVYMPLIDRVNRRVLLAWSTVLQLAAFVPFIFFEATFLTSLINVVLFGAGAGIGQQSLFQLWSGELFPTLLRSHRAGLHVRRRADRARRLAADAAVGRGLRLQDAVGDPVRDAARQRPGRRAVRARHDRPRPARDRRRARPARQRFTRTEQAEEPVSASP